MRYRRLVAIALAGVLGVAIWGTVVAFGQGGSSQTPRFAVLNGGHEVGANGEAAAGDLNGYGGATVVVRGRRVCWGVSWANLSRVVAAHIHRGSAGENGPVLVDFNIRSAGLSGGTGSTSGCATVSRSLANNIKNNSGNFYVNVHTSQFPPGAIRGQLQ